MSFPHEFVTFMNEAVTNFHAVEASKVRLLEAGFQQISEFDNWQNLLQPGGKYFFARNDTTVIAFRVGSQCNGAIKGYTVLAAHTDSPCLKIKPVACVNKSNALLFNTQPYGGGLWHTWFDRDLGIAGRIILRTNDGQLSTKLFRIDEPIARISNLAIHLTSGTERESFAPNLHEHGKAIISISPEFVDQKPANEREEQISQRIHIGLLRMIAKESGVSTEDIEDIEMQLIDTQASTLGGACKEFIYSGRLDNLCSAYQSLRAVIDFEENEHNSNYVQISMLFDHEEIGSASAQGAASSLFMDTLNRIQRNVTKSESSEGIMTALRRSFVVSADMAHSLHPNYPQKHDSSMAPFLNKGLVIKHNANQRYATNGVSASLFRHIGRLAKVNVQEFTVRADAGCGSTVGPILSTLSGILTVDCGTPQLSMHSIREVMGTQDAANGYEHFKAVFQLHPQFSENLDSIKK